MATNDTHSDGFDVSTDNQLSDREIRALAEYMTISYDGGSMFQVATESGSVYTVDTRANRCTCKDHQHNLPDGDETQCKHRLRIAFATGERAIPGHVDMDAVKDLNERHLDAEPRVAMADGGLFREGRERFETERVDGGALVWDHGIDGPGRELAGFSHPDGVDAIDWAAIRQELARRGLGVGAVHHKTEFAPQEVGV